MPSAAEWVVRVLPARRKVGRSQRDADREPRPRRLDERGRRVVCLLAAHGRSLREIAAAVGVSHETVRALRGVDSARRIG